VYLGRIRQHRRQIRRQENIELDHRGNRRPQQFERLGHHVAQLHGHPLLLLAAAEGQYLLHQLRRAVRPLQHQVEITVRARIAFQSHFREFHIPDDRTQDVVEIMRDSARQRSDRLQLLRLPELLLQMAPLGDVLRRADDAINRPRLVLDRKSPVAHPAQLSVGSHDPVDFMITPAGLQVESRDYVGPVFLVDGLDPGGRIAVKTPACPAPDRLVGGTDIKDLSRHRVAHPEHFVDVLRKLAESFLAFTQRPLGAVPLRQVADDAQQLPVRQGPRADLGRERRPVFS